MMRLSTVLLATVASGSAWAADKGAKLELNLPLLGYSSSSTKTKPDQGAEAKETKTSLDTASGSDAYLKVYGGGAVVTLWYPFSNAQQKVGAGWAFNPLLEAGLTLGLNSSKEKESKATNNANTYGLYVETEPKLGPVTLEVFLGYEASAEKGKAVTTSTTTGTKTTEDFERSNSKVQLSALAFYPLESNLSYGAGLTYSSTSKETKKPKADKQKFTASEFGVTIASLRLVLD